MIVYISRYHSFAVRDRTELSDGGHLLPLEVVEVVAGCREDQWPCQAGFTRAELALAQEHAEVLEASS